jgi:hypothetical protein
MAGKADFPDAEWQTLKKWVMVAADTRVAGRLELFRHVQRGRRTGRIHRGCSPEEAPANSSAIWQRRTPAASRFAPHLRSWRRLDASGSALAILQLKVSEETSAYGAFVLDIAESVANAVSGVAASERAAIEKIRGALQIV